MILNRLIIASPDLTASLRRRRLLPERDLLEGGSLNPCDRKTIIKGLNIITSPVFRFSSPDISTSRPTSTGSKSSLHTPDPGDSERKRAGSPSPGTSKQRREVTSAASSTSGGDARGSGGDETRR